MSTTFELLLTTGNLLLLIFLFTWWFKLILLVLFVLAGLIFHSIKVKGLKGEKADLERQLLEKNELLLYASKNEQRANERAQAEEKNKALLMSKINHEIRTPMNAVFGMSSLLKETSLTSEQEGYVATITSSGENLLKVINEIMMNDILEYSKVESGKELEAKDLDLSNCLEEVLEVFAVKASKAGIDLAYYIEESVPAQIVGDLRRLRQILMNLVENSIRYTKKGEIFIGVQLLHCKEDNQIKLEFEVRDTGAGMSAEKVAALTKGFAITNNSLHVDKTSGTGLIICKRLVKLMGGSIQVKSTENEGTTFIFSIYSKAGTQPLRSQVQAQMAELEEKRILIVDDNATVAEVLKKRMERLKMVTSVAASGSEALEILTQVSFDLVITDLNMPGMDGIELAQAVQKQYPNLPLFLLTDRSDDRHKQYPDLFAAEIGKPVRPHLLLEAMYTLLRNNEQSPTSKPSMAHKLSVDFSKKYPLNILMAEDNPVNQQWTSKILSKLGYGAQIANNGKEVLEMVSTHHYDIILMDVQMPIMDGLEATRMIRLCLTAQPVIMAMTANVMQGDRQDCFQSGMDDYISKPLELNEFVSKLEKWALLIKEKRQFQLQSRA